MGVPPSGSGSRAPHEAATASSPKASIPNAVADKLREARALIERGWTQGEFAEDRDDSEQRCYCASGAIGIAADRDALAGEADEHEQSPAFRAACAALGAAIGCSQSYEIARWNDAPERTQAEVLAAFDKAIELAEAGQ